MTIEQGEAMNRLEAMLEALSNEEIMRNGVREIERTYKEAETMGRTRDEQNMLARAYRIEAEQRGLVDY